MSDAGGAVRDLLEPVVGVARAAAERILHVYRGEFDVRSKADASPVTEADLAADALIREGLTPLGPGYPVISEETGAPSFETRRDWRTLWMVDPLDGTQGFVRRSGEFVVSIALVRDGYPVLGVIHAPVEGVSYLATGGDGARKRLADGRTLAIRTRTCPRDRISVVTSRSRRNVRSNSFVERLGDVAVERMGSALKLCRIAEGRADVHPGFSATSEWDTAAAQCILEEAGGALVDTRGHRLRYNERPTLENPRFLACGDTRVDWAGRAEGL